MAKGHIVRRGKVWYARFYDGTGHRQWQSLKTNSREIAQAKFSKVIQAIEKHEVGWRLKGKLVSEYLAEYLALCEAEHSKRTYRVEKQILEEFTRLKTRRQEMYVLLALAIPLNTLFVELFNPK